MASDLKTVPIGGESCREYVNRLTDIDEADGVLIVTLKRRGGDWSTCVSWHRMQRGDRAYAALVVQESARVDQEEIVSDKPGG